MKMGVQEASAAAGNGAIWAIILILAGLFLMGWGAIRFFAELAWARQNMPQVGERIRIVDGKAYPFVKSGDTATVVMQDARLKTVGVHAGEWPDRGEIFKKLYPDDHVLIFGNEEVDLCQEPEEGLADDELMPEPEGALRPLDMPDLIGIVQPPVEVKPGMVVDLGEMPHQPPVAPVFNQGEAMRNVQQIIINPNQEEAQALTDAVEQMQPGQVELLIPAVDKQAQNVTDPPKSKRMIALEAANTNRQATAYTRACCILYDIGEGMSLENAAKKYGFSTVRNMVRSVLKQGLENPREAEKRAKERKAAAELCEPAESAAADAG